MVMTTVSSMDEKWPAESLNFGERVDFAVDKRTPALDLGGRNAHSLEPIDDAVREARDGLGHERDGKDAKQNAAVAAKAKDAQQRHVAIALGEKRHAGKQQNGAPGNEAKLIHDKARELRGAGLAHVLACLGQAVDLGGVEPIIMGVRLPKKMPLASTEIRSRMPTGEYGSSQTAIA